MINSINDVNTLQITNAINAFKNTVRPIIKEEFQEENSALDSSIDIQAGKQRKEDFSNIGLLKTETRMTAQTQNYIFELENKTKDEEYQKSNECKIVRPKGIILFGFLCSSS